MGFNIIATLLCFAEMYHFVTHAFILFRVRLLPRKDLVRVRYYFLLDTLTVFVTNFLYTGALRWLATLQIIQHLFYFIFWENASHPKKVASWSSLDWLKSVRGQTYEWDAILGTGFDVVVHAINVYLLCTYMSSVEVIAALVLTQALLYVIIFNPRFAWSSPSLVPKWVEKRIQPIPDDDQAVGSS